MDNQAVFNALADLEEAFFYRKNDPRELVDHADDLKEMHKTVKALLIQWHSLTGCVNEI